MVCCQNGRTYLVLLGPALLQCTLHLGDPLDPLTSQEGMRTLRCDFIGSPPRLLPTLWNAQWGQMLLALVVPLVANAVELLLGAGVRGWPLTPGHYLDRQTQAVTPHTAAAQDGCRYRQWELEGSCEGLRTLSPQPPQAMLEHKRHAHGRDLASRLLPVVFACNLKVWPPFGINY